MPTPARFGPKDDPNSDDCISISDDRYQWPLCPPVFGANVRGDVVSYPRVDVVIGPTIFSVISVFRRMVPTAAFGTKNDPNSGDCIPISTTEI